MCPACSRKPSSYTANTVSLLLFWISNTGQTGRVAPFVVVVCLEPTICNVGIALLQHLHAVADVLVGNGEPVAGVIGLRERLP